MPEISLNEMKNLLNEQKSDTLREMNNKFMELKLDIRKVTKIAEKADALASSNHGETLQLQTYVDDLKEANKSLSASLGDQINRSMRSTLIFKGIKEEAHETWDQTEKILTEVISRHLKIDADHIAEMIERAHRGRQSSDRKGPRHIYVKFFSWKDSETVKNGFSNLCRQHPNMGIRAVQMFSKELTKRRNDAMPERQKLIAAKEISNGYLVYPATLMIKRLKTDKQYTKFQSF